MMMRTSLSRASTLRVNNALPAVASRSFSTEFFPGIPKIQYDPSSKPTDLTFKYYNADEVLMGKTMEDWCRFSVVWWHTFRWGGQDPFGMPTLNHPWDDGGNSVDNAKVRVDAAFEFFTKLGRTQQPILCDHIPLPLCVFFRSRVLPRQAMTFRRF